MTSTMNRIDHNAVRRDLDRFAGALASFRESEHQRAGQLAEIYGVSGDGLVVMRSNVYITSIITSNFSDAVDAAA